MNISLIVSVIGNILLFLLLLLFILLYFTYQSKTCPAQCNNTVNPSQNGMPNTSLKYTLKTLSGQYVQSNLIDTNNLSIVASDHWNGDTIQFIPTGTNQYNIAMQIASVDVSNASTIYLTMSPLNLSTNILKATQIQNDKGAVFDIVPYLNTFGNAYGSNIYQIGSQLSGTLLGLQNPSCLNKNGLNVIDGFNFYVNMPRGMSDRSLFLLLPASCLNGQNQCSN